jgi:hypothetical protein
MIFADHPARTFAIFATVGSGWITPMSAVVDIMSAVVEIIMAMMAMMMVGNNGRRECQGKSSYEKDEPHIDVDWIYLRIMIFFCS